MTWTREEEVMVEVVMVMVVMVWLNRYILR